MVEELEDTPTRRYRYRLVVNAKRDVEALLAALRDGNQMFTTRVVEANPWYKPIIAPKGKSFFFRIFWWAVVMALVTTAVIVVYGILSNEELKSELMEALDLFRDG